MATLPSCAATRVHLFSHGLQESQLAELERVLQARGYETAVNTLPVPEGIDGPTLLYSPEHHQPERVEVLGNMLIDMGYDVILEPVSRGNHFYTGDNVGLYLKPHSQTMDQGKALEGREFNGDCETLDAYLNFDTARFSIEFIAWDEVAQEEDVSKIEGVWRRRSDTVTLGIGTEQVDLELIPIKNRTQYGSFEGIRLINRTAKLNGCHFIYNEFGSLE